LLNTCLVVQLRISPGTFDKSGMTTTFGNGGGPTGLGHLHLQHSSSSPSRLDPGAPSASSERRVVRTNPMLFGVRSSTSKGDVDVEDDDGMDFSSDSRSGINYWLFFDVIGLTPSRSTFSHFVKAGMRPRVLRERCKNKWGIVAITSSVVASIALQNVTQSQALAKTPSQPDAPLEKLPLRAFVVFNFTSGCLNLLAVTIITVAWAALEGTPEKYTRELLAQYYYVMSLPGACFVFGSISLLLGYLVFIATAFGENVFWMSIVAGCGITLFCLVLQTSMHRKTLEFLEKEYAGSDERLAKSAKSGSRLVDTSTLPLR